MLEAHEYDQDAQELVDLLLATGAFVDDSGPGPHVWEQIEAAVADERCTRAATPITSARSHRARRHLTRTVLVAAAITLAGGAAAFGAWGPLRGDDAPAPADSPSPSESVDAPGAERALGALPTVAARADDARSAPGAQVVPLVDAAGRVVAELVVLPDGEAFLLGNLPDDAVPYVLYAVTEGVRTVLAVVEGSGVQEIARLPVGALVVELVDAAGTVIAHAPLGAPSPPEPPATPEVAPAPRVAEDPTESVSPAPVSELPPSDPAPPEASPPPPPSPPGGIHVELPLLGIELHLFG